MSPPRVFGLAAGLLGTLAVADARDITTCGETVDPGETAVLQADLGCTGAFGVRLLAGATLNLNGRAIRGGSEATVVGAHSADGDPLGSGPARFTIIGPGEIANDPPQNYDPALHAFRFACIRLNDGRARITSAAGVVEIHSCSTGVRGSEVLDFGGRGRLEMEHAHLHDVFLSGTELRRLVASDVEVHDCGLQTQIGGAGLVARRIIATNVLAYANRRGPSLSAGRIRGIGITASDSYEGVFVLGSAYLKGLMATSHDNPGVVAEGALRIVDSQVTGNGLGPTHPGVDIQSRRRPRLQNTTCGLSEVTGQVGGTRWGVCAND